MSLRISTGSCGKESISPAGKSGLVECVSALFFLNGLRLAANAAKLSLNDIKTNILQVHNPTVKKLLEKVNKK